MGALLARIPYGQKIETRLCTGRYTLLIVPSLDCPFAHGMCSNRVPRSIHSGAKQALINVSYAIPSWEEGWRVSPAIKLYSSSLTYEDLTIAITELCATLDLVV